MSCGARLCRVEPCPATCRVRAVWRVVCGVACCVACSVASFHVMSHVVVTHHLRNPGPPKGCCQGCGAGKGAGGQGLGQWVGRVHLHTPFIGVALSMAAHVLVAPEHPPTHSTTIPSLLSCPAASVTHSLPKQTRLDLIVRPQTMHRCTCTHAPVLLGAPPLLLCRLLHACQHSQQLRLGDHGAHHKVGRPRHQRGLRTGGKGRRGEGDERADVCVGPAAAAWRSRRTQVGGPRHQGGLKPGGGGPRLRQAVN